MSGLEVDVGLGMDGVVEAIGDQRSEDLGLVAGVGQDLAFIIEQGFGGESGEQEDGDEDESGLRKKTGSGGGHAGGEGNGTYGTYLCRMVGLSMEGE